MKSLVIIIILGLMVVAGSFYPGNGSLRDVYSKPGNSWPPPFIDTGIVWKELDVLPPGPLAHTGDSIASIIKLGSILFFDNRLSGSGKISCASCHQPELSWTDGKPRSSGHEGTLNKRNSPSLQNVWFYSKLFWDGRSHNLEDQAFAPINSESEMHSDMRTLPANLRKIKGYPLLFNEAFGDPMIDPDRIALALATFQRTITSGRTRFDEFLSGNKKALSNSEIRGLHLFRTKARCLNCHHGALFTDNHFHNNGFAGKDPGRYNVTHAGPDSGKFKTPGLRSVTFTGPWMHAGEENSLEEIIDQYNKGGREGGEALVRPLHLTKRERKDLLSFLKAISVAPRPFIRPAIPE